MSPVTRTKTKLSWRWLSAELKRREVYPVIVAYAIVGWILLQIGEVTFDPLGVPGWVMPTLIVVVIAGFPIALALAWMYDITPQGVRRDRIPSPIVLYNVACNFATLGEVDESLDYLEQAVEQGTVSSDWMRNDEDLVSLRGNPRYAALLQRVEANESTHLIGA